MQSQEYVTWWKKWCLYTKKKEPFLPGRHSPKLRSSAWEVEVGAGLQPHTPPLAKPATLMHWIKHTSQDSSPGRPFLPLKVVLKLQRCVCISALLGCTCDTNMALCSLVDLSVAVSGREGYVCRVSAWIHMYPQHPQPWQPFPHHPASPSGWLSLLTWLFTFPTGPYALLSLSSAEQGGAEPQEWVSQSWAQPSS